MATGKFLILGVACILFPLDRSSPYMCSGPLSKVLRGCQRKVIYKVKNVATFLVYLDFRMVLSGPAAVELLIPDSSSMVTGHLSAWALVLFPSLNPRSKIPSKLWLS